MEVIQQIHAQGGLAFLPHPFARRLTIEERVAKALDGCEGFNSRHSRVKILNNTYGESHIFEFAKIYDLTLIAGSDAHFYREIGRARTIIPAGSLEEVKEVLQMGNTALMGRHSSVLNMLNSVMVGLVKRFFFPMPQSKSSLSNTVR
jgi:predicted metal-dependent phosphoesterase TrpH